MPNLQMSPSTVSAPAPPQLAASTSQLTPATSSLITWHVALWADTCRGHVAAASLLYRDPGWRMETPALRRPRPEFPHQLPRCAPAAAAVALLLELQTNLREDYAKFYNHGEGTNYCPSRSLNGP